MLLQYNLISHCHSPNAERFWKSLESLIRTKVLRAVDETKISALDIGKLSCLIDKNVEELVKSVSMPEPEPVIAPEPIPVPEPTPPIVIEKKKREYRKWSDNEKKEFVDKYYKHGIDAAAKEYGISRQAAMKNYSRFNKEVKDGKIS